MITVTVQIGNSDDKLSQEQWSFFYQEVRKRIESYASEVHFSGSSLPFASWQNAAIIFTINEHKTTALAKHLTEIRKQFNQDSLAWTEGDTIFI